MKGMKKKPVNGSGYTTVGKASTSMGATTAKGINGKGNMAYCPKLSKL